MKKIIMTICFALAILSIIPTLTASANEAYRYMTPEEVPEEQYKAAEKLYKLGLFQEVTRNKDGSPNFALNYYTTRIEGIKIVIRFTGEEQKAKQSKQYSPFEDVKNADVPYTAFAYNKEMIHGVHRTNLLPNQTLTADFFLTSLLQTLNYDCGTNYNWCTSWEKTDEIQITNNDFNEENNTISRGEIAEILFKTLTQTPKDQEQTVIDQMIENDTFKTLVETQQVRSKKLYDAVKANDKDLIKEVIEQIINGTDCDYTHCCCPICCEPEYRKPIKKETETNEQNNKTPGNNQTTPQTPTTPQPPSSPQKPNTPPENNDKESNKPEKPDDKDNDKDKEPDKCKDCDCEIPVCDKDCNNHDDCHRSDCPNCEENNCRCNNNCCKKEDCEKCKDHVCDNNKECPDCKQDDKPKDCNGENKCNDPDCQKCNSTDNECDSENRCNDPNCPICKENDNNCDSDNKCNDPECPICKDTPNDCNSPDGCGDPNCQDCNKDENNCDPKNKCTDPDCPKCNEKTNDCNSPEGCGDPNCQDCNKDENDCDSEGGCNDPDCPFCNNLDNDCDSQDGCKNPECPNCNDKENDCDSENGCNDPNCPNCKQEETECDGSTDCDNEDCPFCKDTNDCNSEDGCNNPECPNCNKNDCDSKEGCNDPNCPSCNKPDTWPKSLLNVTDEGTRIYINSSAEWKKVRDTSELPTGTHHKDALVTDCYMFQQTRMVYEFDKTNLYKALSFTAYNTSIYNARIQIFDYETDTLLWSYMLNAGKSVYVDYVDISSTNFILFTAELVDAPTSYTYYDDAIIIADPLVDREPEPDTSYPGIEGAVSLLKATGIAEKTTHGNVGRWIKVINRDELPPFNYHEAIKTDSLFLKQTTKSIFPFIHTGVYKTLDFTAYNGNGYTALLQIFDNETREELWSTILEAGKNIKVTGVDISRASELEFHATLTNTPTSTQHYFNAIYLCNPLVFFEHDECTNPDCLMCNADKCKECKGELCENCNECKECSTTLCSECCEHSWGEWSDYSSDEEEHSKTRTCSKCQANDTESELHSIYTYVQSWAWSMYHWQSVLDIHILEELLDETIDTNENTCQFRFRKCVTCDYLDYDIEEHLYGDDWDMRDYFTKYDHEKEEWITVDTEPYYLAFINWDSVPGSGDDKGRGDTCIKYKQCQNWSGGWSGWKCKFYYNEPEPHNFKMYNECDRWAFIHDAKRIHQIYSYIPNESSKTYNSLAEIGSFDEIVSWLNEPYTVVACTAGWCSKCTVSIYNTIKKLQVNDWYEWNGSCRRTIVCVFDTVWNTVLWERVPIEPCNDILYEETKPHDFSDYICIDCGADYDIAQDFTDPVFLAEVRSIIGKETGEIYRTDVSHITEYKSNKGGIKSFAGVEHFPNLKTFDYTANDNLVEFLDVTQNPKLTYLRINHQKLSELDLSMNIALTEIHCDYNRITELLLPDTSTLKTIRTQFNQMTSIDVTKNPELTFLSISWNKVETIDVSNNNKLTNLSIDYNKIEILDLSQNSELGILSFHSNPISSIDLSFNKKLTNLSFGATSLTEIDLSNNTKLIGLTIRSQRNFTTIDLSALIGLGVLTLGRTDIENLDISKNTELSMLTIEYIDMNNLDLSKNTKLSNITFSHSNLYDINLSKQTALRILDLTGNNLTSLDLTNSPLLTRLELKWNKFPNTSAVILPEGVNWGGNIVFGNQIT